MTDRYSFMNFFNVTLSVVLVTGLAIGGCTEPKPNRNVIGSVEEARLLPPGTTNVGIHASRLNNVKAMLEALQQSGIKSLDFNSSFVDAEVFNLVRGIDSLESVSITAASGFDVRRAVVANGSTQQTISDGSQLDGRVDREVGRARTNRRTGARLHSR